MKAIRLVASPTSVGHLAVTSTERTVRGRVGGFTCHPQELASFSWFYHQKPSQGVDGWYSGAGRGEACGLVRSEGFESLAF
jgi:hypothetical protein